MNFKTDIEIAQECKMQPITEIAKAAKVPEEYIEQYGKYKAKISNKLIDELLEKVNDIKGEIVLIIDGNNFVGENQLNKLSLEYGEGYFNHNVQSVRTLMTLENNGKGKNISIQVLDAILCHNGEILEEKYYPVEKTKEDFLREYEESYKDLNVSKKIRPMTLEGCVVRISDIIGYAGKDIEDAIRLGIITEEDIPEEIVTVLGKTNAEIVNTLVLDIINNSVNKPYIKLSKNVFNALNKLIKFNYERIYNVINATKEIRYYEEMYTTLFNYYKKALDKNDISNDIYRIFLNGMSEDYLNNTSNVRKVIDYIAGMTDDYFINRYNELSNIKVKR